MNTGTACKSTGTACKNTGTTRVLQVPPCKYFEEPCCRYRPIYFSTSQPSFRTTGQATMPHFLHPCENHVQYLRYHLQVHRYHLGPANTTCKYPAAGTAPFTSEPRAQASELPLKLRCLAAFGRVPCGASLPPCESPRILTPKR